MIRILLITYSMSLLGMFGESAEVKSLQVKEGDSVTLTHQVFKIQPDIEWRFKGVRIAEIINNNVNYQNNSFGDRLKLDTDGSLTIRNIKSTDAGLYKINTFPSHLSKTFNVYVYAPVSIPIIACDISQCSSSSTGSSHQKHLLVCSVFNVSHVTLSWLKGNSLLSSISVSDLSISLSLPLEVEDQDNNTYSCVARNPVSNETKHLRITGLCCLCSDEGYGSTETVIRLVSTALVGLAAVAAFIVLVYDIKSRAEQEKHQAFNDGSDIVKQE